MKTRRERGIRVNDFADTLNDMLAKLDTEEYKKLGITETTVMSQALIFFLAGKHYKIFQMKHELDFLNALMS